MSASCQRRIFQYCTIISIIRFLAFFLERTSGGLSINHVQEAYFPQPDVVSGQTGGDSCNTSQGEFNGRLKIRHKLLSLV